MENVYGKLAYKFGGVKLELRVEKSAAGYYLGCSDKDGPVSRESSQYFECREDAERALMSGAWTQRESP
jgi:hypothetical protein